MNDQKQSQTIRLVFFGGWTLLWAAYFLWQLWAVGSATEGTPDADLVRSCGCIMAAGCSGGIWLVGVAVAAVVYSLLRR